MRPAPPPFARPPRGGVTWRLAGERLGLLAWPRAILLQLAHPLVAAGVAAHSGFRASPWAPYARLHSTTRAMRRLTFGSDADAQTALAGILRIHDRVHGALGADVPPHHAGDAYSAHDPALLLWVHATLLDSYARILGEVLGPVPARDLDAYCAESAGLAIALGARDADVPRTWTALQTFMADAVSSGQVSVGPDARELAPAILRPPLSWMAWPVRRAGELVTVGSLPPSLRAQYGFTWTADDERRRARTVALVRSARAGLPLRLARWPESR
ncbi:MAG: oxygenase MpaB family protein [Vicinamibacteria bacterium]